MEQMPLQAVRLQTNTTQKTSPSSDSKETGETSSFESLLADKQGEMNQKPVSKENLPEEKDTAEDLQSNTALLEKAAANMADNLAWGNLMVDLASLKQDNVQDISGVLATEQMLPAEQMQTAILPETPNIPENPMVQTESSPTEIISQTVPQTTDSQPTEQNPMESVSQPLETPVEQITSSAEKETGSQDQLFENTDTSSESKKQELEVLNSETAPEQPLFRNVDAMPVKVGDSSVLDTETPNFDTNLSQTIQQALDQGTQKIQIQLKPENLGNIVVEMTQDSNGMLHVVLHADNDRTARFLQDHSTALSDLLQNSRSGQVHVEVPSQQSNQESWQPPDQRNSGGQHRQHQNSRQNTEDFLNQLRLGLLQTIQE